MLLGSVQGSILGAVLYALYVSSLLYLEFLLAFGDESYVPTNIEQFH
jgi:hypothetical protein